MYLKITSSTDGQNVQTELFECDRVVHFSGLARQSSDDTAPEVMEHHFWVYQKESINTNPIVFQYDSSKYLHAWVENADGKTIEKLIK